MLVSYLTLAAHCQLIQQSDIVIHVTLCIQCIFERCTDLSIVYTCTAFIAWKGVANISIGLSVAVHTICFIVITLQ